MTPRTPALLAAASALIAMVATVEQSPALERRLQTAATGGPAVTYSKHIAPIIFEHCSPCHRPGEIAPFSLVTYADARPRARQIAIVTARRAMPPWKPEPGKGEFQGQRRLSEDQIRLFQEWTENGAPEGSLADLPPPPTWTGEWPRGTPDLIVRMTEPYQLQADGSDVFRTFVVAIPIASPRYVTAVEFRPANARAIHHVNLGIERTGSSRRRDLMDSEPGFAGGMEPDAGPAGQMLGWTPGQALPSVPSGIAWRLDKESDVVAQLHLHPTGRPEAVQFQIGFYFTDDPPSRTPAGLRLGSQTIDVPAGEREYEITDSYNLPVDVELLAVRPHAHHLARKMEATATLPDGTMKWLISIGDWDFNWQDVYRYTEPVALPRGTRIAMRYVYDNSAGNLRNPHRPPRRVFWGQATSDEMGDLWLQVVTRSSADLAILTQDFRRKSHAQDLAGFRKRLEVEPTDPFIHDTLAGLYLESDRADSAVVHLRESLRLKPESASAHYNLGVALSRQERYDEALAQFREAVRFEPDYAEAHNNLGGMHELLGQPTDALQSYRRAVELRPDNARSHSNVARIFLAIGRAPEAIAHFRQALTLDSAWPPALAGLSWILSTTWEEKLRNPDEAIGLAERAAELTGYDASALDVLAAAYAAAGRFDHAATAARSGIDRAVADGNGALAGNIRQRLQLYSRRQPYRTQRP